MIPAELAAEARRLYYAEHWKVGTIASHLGVHHETVRQALDLERPRSLSRPRPSRVDPYLPFVRETWERYPFLTASRIYWMCRARGYLGAANHFRDRVKELRPRRKREAFLRLQTLPGEEAQVDWAHFGKVAVGRALRPLMAFVMVLSYSRRMYLRFFLDGRLGNFLRGHCEAFETFGAVPRRVLTDNLRSVVLDRVSDVVGLHPVYRDFADHYHFEGRPVGPYRPCEKGRVERSVRTIRSAFYAARTWRDLGDLNAQARAWCEEESLQRRWPQDPSKTVKEAFEEERSSLLALPAAPYPTEDRQEARVGKTPYVRFDGNDYSVPAELVRETVVVLADDRTIRILYQDREVARHTRSFDRRATVEDPEHIAQLVADKRRARRGRGTHRLLQAVPSSERFLAALTRDKVPLGNAIAQLLDLLQTYGSRRLERAIQEAVARGIPHLAAVRQVLEREIERQDPAPRPVSLPDDPRVRELVVRPHSLEGYDALALSPESTGDPPIVEDRDEEEHDDDDDDQDAAAALVVAP